MAGKYFYKGVDINDLIQPGGTVDVNGYSFYSGFPKTVTPVGANGTRLYTNFASPGGFTQLYKFNTNTDIGINPNSGNLSTISEFSARYIDYYYTDGSKITITSPFTPCNHISVACIGGGGGSGGGGGIGQGVSVFTGGNGGDGGDGGYAAAEKIPLNGQAIYLTVGKGGSGGGGGPKADPNFHNEGGDGSPGGNGGPTTLNIGNTNILTGYGGDGGSGGGGGNKANFGGNGGNGNFVDGYVNPSFGGNAQYITSNLTNERGYEPVKRGVAVKNFHITPYEKGYGYGVNGGSGGISHKNGADAGSPGSNGWCRIYFLLI
jgi:hypothetical protein